MAQKEGFRMYFSQDELAAIKQIESLRTSDLVEKIKRISLAAWNGQLEILTLQSWLSNFRGEYLNNLVAEQNLALWLVQHFVFYTDKDIRSLSVNLWWKYIHFLLDRFERNGFMKENSIDEKRNYILKKTVIQPLGNCAGSGTNVCYFFRQANGLDKSMFDMGKEKEYEFLVLADDATISGFQTAENLGAYKTIDKEKFVLTFISTQKARSHISDSAHIISSIELDEKSQCFSNSSYVFSRHQNWANIAKKMCQYYGKKIDPHNPIGFRRGGYLFGFYYNIPNNTLPIFWGTLGGWTPLFNRYFSEHEEIEGEKNEAFV